jgi:hypothetical protein
MGNITAEKATASTRDRVKLDTAGRVDRLEWVNLLMHAPSEYRHEIRSRTSLPCCNKEGVAPWSIAVAEVRLFFRELFGLP